jgi:hypothetical protein
MKTIFSLCLLLATLLTRAQQEKPDPNFHVYLLIGQSNMAGRGRPDSESKKTNPRILMLDKENVWVPATDPVHFDKPGSAGVGPAISFAREMLAGDSKTKIGLIPCALGGSPIRVWQPDSVYLKVWHPYDDALRRAQLALQQGVLKGILWHQGESDNTRGRSALYLENLKTLVNRLRTDLGLPHIPFVAGEIGYFNQSNYINPVVNLLPQQVPQTAVVSASGLAHKGDSLHFDTPSARELGKRYAAALKGLQATGKQAGNAQKKK